MLRTAERVRNFRASSGLNSPSLIAVARARRSSSAARDADAENQTARVEMMMVWMHI
jgi:hypothetical protein